MKPIVYLAAFQKGKFNLDTPVPTNPSAFPLATQDAKALRTTMAIQEGMIPPVIGRLAEIRGTGQFRH